MIEPLSERDGDPLAKLVAHARELEVDYDVEAGIVRHRAAVASAPAGGGWSRWFTPTTGVIAVIVVAVGAAIAWPRGESTVERAPVVEASAASPSFDAPIEDRHVEPARPSVTPTKDAPAAATIADAPAAATNAAPANASRETRPRARAPKPDVPSTSDDTKADADALAREAAAIRRARGLLEQGDAEAALALCNDIERDFPRGTFVPERSGIRVLALHALGRPHEASARAWLSKWPDGTLAPRIRRTLMVRPPVDDERDR